LAKALAPGCRLEPAPAAVPDLSHARHLLAVGQTVTPDEQSANFPGTLMRLPL
jgi:hypothetical protein